MKFKSIAAPQPSVGESYLNEVRQTVPDQNMSLAEILERFTRNEALPIGKAVNYHESDDDLEKVQNMDLVDRQEFAEKLTKTQKDYEKQEKRKTKERERVFREQERAKIAAEEREKSKKEGGTPAT